jgi:hypothetical protein
MSNHAKPAQQHAEKEDEGKYGVAEFGQFHGIASLKVSSQSL